MDCREAKEMLSAYHDGELSEADRAKVAAHVDGCAECAAVLDTMARADAAAAVPDPGPAYWERFNRRVEARVAREERAPQPKPAAQPKRGWARWQLRYLVPAAAAAVLAVVIFRSIGPGPGTPAPVQAPPTTAAPAPPSAAQETAAGAPGTAMRRDADEATVGKGRAAAAAPSAAGKPGTEATPAAETGRGKASDDGCEAARALAAGGRLDAAEAAQRACLARDDSPAAQERGLVYLTELLDRQHRFAEADQVIEELKARFPDSRPLKSYLQRRSQVQGLPAPSPKSTLR